MAAISGSVVHLLNEAFIDLHHVDGKIAQVGKRRAAGAEVVKRYGRSGAFELIERASDIFGAAAEKRVLRHFDFDARRRDLAAVQDRQQALGIIVAQEFGGRGVDRDTPELEPRFDPLADIARDLVLHEVADLGSQLVIAECFFKGRGQLQPAGVGAASAAALRGRPSGRRKCPLSAGRAARPFSR